MYKITKSSVLVAALLCYLVIVSTNVGVIQSAKAQTTVGGQTLSALANLGDQVVNEGNHVVDQIHKGGLGFLKSALAAVGIHNIQVRINEENQDLAKGNTSGAILALNQIDKALVNDSSLMYGLGQRISELGHNNSAITDSHSREELSAIGTALKNLALDSVGAKANSTSGTTG
ncbi:MAG TPA: hypothetical protein VE089_11615 [Nitrososphaeraceae archaeon]|jgi:hypothetical protein|nr:hypothetical protein [Nitrososphaeraceae archaeon]